MARSNMYNDVIRSYYDTSYLSHYGVKGQKWGVRNYQNEDGTYTSKGKAHRHDNGLDLPQGVNSVGGGSAEATFAESQIKPLRMEIENIESDLERLDEDMSRASIEDLETLQAERKDLLERLSDVKQRLQNAEARYDSVKHSNFNDVIKAYYDTSYLCHHGILGMKWGIRRFQNKDGTRTEAGKKRYAKKDTAEKLLHEEGISRSTYKIADREYGRYDKSNCGKDKYLISVNPEDLSVDSATEAKNVIGQMKRIESHLESNLDDIKEQIAKIMYDNGAAKDYYWDEPNKLPSRDEFIKGLRLSGVNTYSTEDLDSELFFNDDNDIYFEGLVLDLDPKGRVKSVYT